MTTLAPELDRNDAKHKADANIANVNMANLENKYAEAVHRLTQNNLRRVPCAHCELSIMPEGMGKHVWACHTDIEDMFDAEGNSTWA